MNLNILFIVIIAVTISNGLKIDELKDLEGLRFEEIGELNLITKYRVLNFHVNYTTVQQLISNATENLDIIKEKLFINDTEKCLMVDNLKDNLGIRDLELRDALHGLIDFDQKNKRSIRYKRFLPILTSDDGKRIQNDLGTLKTTINAVIDDHTYLKELTTNVTHFLNGTMDELGKRATISRAIATNEEINRKVDAIIRAVTKERMNNEIISIREFYERIKNISSNLNESETLPYAKMIEYFYHLRLTHVVENDIIKFKMNVPIVEISPRKLYKIVEIPARYEMNVVLTNVEWKYIASNENETMTLMSLDLCYKRNNKQFYCETEGPIKSIDSPDCLTNAVVNGMIDSKLCVFSSAKLSTLTFIRLNNGQYFYYTPSNETLKVTCKATEKYVDLIENTVGILKLESECRASTSNQKLIRTESYQEEPFIKQNILSISFDIDEVKENLRKYNSPIVDSFYLNSLNTLREMTKPMPKLPTIGELQYKAGISASDMFNYLLVAVFCYLMIQALFKVYKWSLNNCKCLKKGEKNQNNIKTRLVAVRQK